ncbi:MAG: REP-associated tyrosine transposase [Candidatus Cyclobacteriaceae bacterium M2_1C_046]
MSSWKIHQEIEVYFTTSTIVEWLPIFVEEEFLKILTNSLTFCVENKGLKIHGYVIMLNHIHLLSSADGNVSDIMRDFKAFTSHEIVKLLKRNRGSIPLQVFKQAARLDDKCLNYKVWQTGFHPIGIETEKFYNQKLNYIHQNPVRKSLVAKPEYWFYSSAGFYSGYGEGILKIEKL